MRDVDAIANSVKAPLSGERQKTCVYHRVILHVMNRRWLWLAVLIVALSSASAVRYVYKKRRAAANAAAVQATLLKYSQDLKPGMTRKEAKDYLRTQGIGFIERCCDEPRGPFSVLVQVGEEDPHWYCSAWPDYVAFEFATTEALNLRSGPSNSDVLKKVHLVSNGVGCF
jgi:hypothetical protein